MSAKPMTHTAVDEPEAEVPHLLRVVEAASVPSQNDPQTQGGKKAKGTSLGSLKLNWLEQVTNDTGIPDAAFRIGHKIAEHINERELCAWPKLKTIASLLDRSERTVRDSVHALMHRQHIECSKRGSGNLNEYRLLVNGLTVKERDRAEAVAIQASKAASGKRKTEAGSSSIQGQEPASAFERFMRAFPAREGGHNCGLALHTYRLNISYGTTESEMLLGAEAYRKFCDERGVTGTTCVFDAENWLDIGGWSVTDPNDISQNEVSA